MLEKKVQGKIIVILDSIRYNNIGWCYVLKKDNFILVCLLVFIVFLAFLCGYFAYSQNEEIANEVTDASRISNEYAKLNGVINEKNKKEYPKVNLSINNPFVYKNEEEIVRILENGSGIIYFGFASCPWCRTMLPVLEEVSLEKNLKEIYYLDIESIRDTYILDENQKLLKQKEGSSNYYKILRILDQYLKKYILTSKDGRQVDTLEKRLLAPTVVAVLNGEIMGFHEVTVKTQIDGYTPLSSKEKEELKKIYGDLIEKFSSFKCNEGC